MVGKSNNAAGKGDIEDLAEVIRRSNDVTRTLHTRKVWCLLRLRGHGQSV